MKATSACWGYVKIGDFILELVKTDNLTNFWLEKVRKNNPLVENASKILTLEIPQIAKVPTELQKY